MGGRECPFRSSISAARWRNLEGLIPVRLGSRGWVLGRSMRWGERGLDHLRIRGSPGTFFPAPPIPRRSATALRPLEPAKGNNATRAAVGGFTGLGASCDYLVRGIHASAEGGSRLPPKQTRPTLHLHDSRVLRFGAPITGLMDGLLFRLRGSPVRWRRALAARVPALGSSEPRWTPSPLVAHRMLQHERQRSSMVEHSVAFQKRLALISV